MDMFELPGHLARRFQQIAVALFHADAARAGFDLTPAQYVALQTVAACPGVDQAGLAAAIAYDRATINGVVDRLVQKGLLAQCVNPKDRRARILEITPSGLEILAQTAPVVERVQQRLLSPLSQEEAARFMELFRKLVHGGAEAR